MDVGGDRDPQRLQGYVRLFLVPDRTERVSPESINNYIYIYIYTRTH